MFWKKKKTRDIEVDEDASPSTVSRGKFSTKMVILGVSVLVVVLVGTTFKMAVSVISGGEDGATAGATRPLGNETEPTSSLFAGEAMPQTPEMITAGAPMVREASQSSGVAQTEAALPTAGSHETLRQVAANGEVSRLQSEIKQILEEKEALAAKVKQLMVEHESINQRLSRLEKARLETGGSEKKAKTASPALRRFKKEVARALPELRVTGLSEHQAIVNDRVVRVGSVISGARIVQISVAEGRVSLETPDGKRFHGWLQ